MSRALQRATAVTAITVVLVTACGADSSGDSSHSTPPPGSEAAGTPTPPRAIDLSSQPQATSYTARDAGDLVNAGATLALGDFNDDGTIDALIGAPQGDGPDNERNDAGEAYVVFGPLDESLELGAGATDVTIFGAAAGDSLGSSALAGDLNGDGVDDVIIGAPGVTAGFDPRSDQGRIYVFWGDGDFGKNPERDLVEDVFDLTVTGAEGFSRLGHALAMGDVNDDGVQDLIGGAPYAGRKPGTPPGGERTYLGEVYVIYGSEDLEGEKNIARDEFDAALSGRAAYGQFGAAVGAGDVNGDGTDDVVVGAYREGADAQGTSSGFVYVFEGGSDLKGRLSVVDDDQDSTISGPAQSSIGFPVMVADFNGDGMADMALGAQLESEGLLNRQGAVHVVPGSRSLEAEIDAAEAAITTITGGDTGELFPSALAAADLDGDGAADLITGSGLAAAADRQGAGVVRVFSRLAQAPEMLNLSKDASPLTVLGAAADDRLGSAVAGGALTDGTRVLLLAAPTSGADDRNTGVVYVVLVN